VLPVVRHLIVPRPIPQKSPSRENPREKLDPEGVRWIRDLLKSLAAQGRTVFVSSHLISEMALTAERLVVIGRRTAAGPAGRVIRLIRR
jgi:ABC-type multidrug transport system ATPase subunit